MAFGYDEIRALRLATNDAGEWRIEGWVGYRGPLGLWEDWAPVNFGQAKVNGWYLGRAGGSGTTFATEADAREALAAGRQQLERGRVRDSWRPVTDVEP